MILPLDCMWSIVSNLDLPGTKDIEILEQVQWNTTKTFGALEHGRQELHFLGLKRRLRRYLTFVYDYLMVWCREDGVRLILEFHRLRKSSKDHKLEHRKFQQIKGIFTTRMVKQCNRLPREVENLHLFMNWTRSWITCSYWTSFEW